MNFKIKFNQRIYNPKIKLLKSIIISKAKMIRTPTKIMVNGEVNKTTKA